MSERLLDSGNDSGSYHVATCVHMSLNASPILPFPDWIVGFFLSFFLFPSFILFFMLEYVLEMTFNSDKLSIW